MPMMRATRRFSGAGVGNKNVGDLFWAEDERNYLKVAELLGNAPYLGNGVLYETKPGRYALSPVDPAPEEKASTSAENTEPLR